MRGDHAKEEALVMARSELPLDGTRSPRSLARYLHYLLLASELGSSRGPTPNASHFGMCLRASGTLEMMYKGLQILLGNQSMNIQLLKALRHTLNL